ncbi:MAG: NAD kinase [Prevotella sp.]|nr:NAD kinase [Candidatus Equicola faecalis]
MNFALVGNLYQNDICDNVEKLISLLREKDSRLQIEKGLYEYLDSQSMDLRDVDAVRGEDFSADYVISLGGDGTFLQAARYVGRKEIPIVGINTGHLGFLADATIEDVATEFDMLMRGNCAIDRRTVIELVADCVTECPFALNDIAVLKRDTASMISLEISINGEYLATYQADGLVVSTPTGSTAYSLAAGGPVVVPDSGTLTLTAVAPHSLNVRPVVVTDDSVIEIVVESRTGNFLIGVDGQSHKCCTKKITIKKAPYQVKIIKRRENSFFSTLREKLFLGARGNEC